MKRYLLLLATVLYSTLLFGQVPADNIRSPAINPSGPNFNKRAQVDANLSVSLALKIPHGPAFTLNNAKDSIGFVFLNTTTNRFGVYVGNGVWNSYLTATDLPSGIVTSFNGRAGPAITLLSSDVTGALTYTPESVVNKSSINTLGTSNILYPTQGAVKTYVDNQAALKANLNGGNTFSGTQTLNNSILVLTGAAGTQSQLQQQNGELWLSDGVGITSFKNGRVNLRDGSGTLFPYTIASDVTTIGDGRYLQLTGGTLSGALNGTTANFSSFIAYQNAYSTSYARTLVPGETATGFTSVIASQNTGSFLGVETNRNTIRTYRFGENAGGTGITFDGWNGSTWGSFGLINSNGLSINNTISAVNGNGNKVTVEGQNGVEFIVNSVGGARIASGGAHDLKYYGAFHTFNDGISSTSTTITNNSVRASGSGAQIVAENGSDYTTLQTDYLFVSKNFGATTASLSTTALTINSGVYLDANGVVFNKVGIRPTQPTTGAAGQGVDFYTPDKPRGTSYTLATTADIIGIVTDSTALARKIGSADMVQKTYKGRTINLTATPTTPAAGINIGAGGSSNTVLTWVNANGRQTILESPFPNALRQYRLPYLNTSVTPSTLVDSANVAGNYAPITGSSNYSPNLTFGYGLTRSVNNIIVDTTSATGLASKARLTAKITTAVGDTTRLATKNNIVGMLRDSTEFATYTGPYTSVMLKDSTVGDNSVFILLPKAAFTKNGGTRYASSDANKLWFRQYTGRSVNVHWWGVKADWGKPQGNITVTGTDQAAKLQQIINSYYQGNVELYFPGSRLAYGISVPIKLKQGTVLKGEREGFFPYQSTNGVDTVKFFSPSRILAYNRKDAIVIDQTVAYRPQNNGLIDLSVEGTSVGTQDTTAGFKLYTTAGGNPGLNFATNVSFNGFGTGIDFKLANDFHGQNMSVRNSRVGWRNGGNNIVIDGNGEVAFVDTIAIIKGVSFRAQGLQFALYKEGIHLAGATNAMILDNYFYNGKLSTTDNIVFDNAAGNNNILISRNNMAAPKRYGIRINAGGNATISGNTVTGAAFEAIYARQSSDLSVINNSITTPTTSSIFAMRFDTVTNYRNINNFTQSYDFAHRFSQTGGNQVDVYNYGSMRVYGTYAQPGQYRIINYGNSTQSTSYIASGQLLGGGFTLGGTSNSTTEKVTAAYNARATQTYTSTAFGTQLELQGIPNGGSTLTTFFTASENGGKATQFVSTATPTGLITDSLAVIKAGTNIIGKISPTAFARTPLFLNSNITLALNSDYNASTSTLYSGALPPTTGWLTDGSKLITVLATGTGGARITVPAGYVLTGISGAATPSTGYIQISQHGKVQIIPTGTNTFEYEAINGTVTVN